MKTIFSFLVAFVFAGSALAQVAVGDKAPVFTATTDQGSTWKLADYVGKKNVVVYFYPAAMTGGCTKQACAYRDAQPAIESANAVVVGISGDNPEGLKLFKKAETLNFTLKCVHFSTKKESLSANGHPRPVNINFLSATAAP